MSANSCLVVPTAGLSMLAPRVPAGSGLEATTCSSQFYGASRSCVGCQPNGLLTNSDLAMVGFVLQQAVLQSSAVPLQRVHSAINCDNTPSVAWVHRMASGLNTMFRTASCRAWRFSKERMSLSPLNSSRSPALIMH
jgi:hypothetical protein